MKRVGLASRPLAKGISPAERTVYEAIEIVIEPARSKRRTHKYASGPEELQLDGAPMTVAEVTSALMTAKGVYKSFYFLSSC